MFTVIRYPNPGITFWGKKNKIKIILEEGKIKQGNVFALVIPSCFKPIYILNVRQLIEI